MRAQPSLPLLAAALSSALVMGACLGTEDEEGPRGPEGPPGQPGQPGTPGAPALDPDTPLSSMVALAFVDDLGVLDASGNAPTNLADYVKALVHHHASIDPGATEPDLQNPIIAQGLQFPLAAAATDTIRTLAGVRPNVVVKWLDPLAYRLAADEMDLPRFGANADYIAYFGDGWNDDWDGDVVGSAPQYSGDDTAGWVWVNHEYVSNAEPSATSAPTGQHLTLAKFLRAHSVLLGDVLSDTWTAEALNLHAHMHKKQVGGSWLRIVQDPSSSEWHVDKNAGSVRYDATSDTLLRLAGISQSALDHDDQGELLPSGVVVGIHGDCSGGQTPWGTVFTAEENVQNAYGDLEAAWGANQELILGQGFDPGSTIELTFAPSPGGDMVGANVERNGHNRDFYGYLAEIDPGLPASEYDGRSAAGVGHKKIGAMGRARWENATFAVDENWKLVPGQPIVVYAGSDRVGGRIYKLVTSESYTEGMTRAEVRALLDEGTLYVAHFEDLDHATGNTLVDGSTPTEASPGTGRWIALSLDNTEDDAPNAAALGAPGTKVGAALADVDWNGIGGFASQDDVLWAMFTAANKIGVSQLNRPEDVEWNPLDPSGTPRIYVAFTNHTRRVAVDQDGVLYPPAQHEELSPTRADRVGAIFALEEEDPGNPGVSRTFAYFEVWHGSQGKGLFDAANPDNIAIDADGAVWFGTDGNFGVNGHADALYYLDLDVTHQTTPTPTYGKAFRVVAAPSDAEATGPAFSAGMRTLFFNVQHPGENVYSSWPQRR